MNLELIKSKRITSLPIINKRKLELLHQVFNQNIIMKNQVSTLLNNDKDYQEKLFTNQNLKSEYKKYKTQKYLAWEIQKFVNDDFILKDQERVYRYFQNFKAKLFQNQKRISTKLSKLLESLVQYEFYQYILKENHPYKLKLESLINLHLNSYSENIQTRLLKLKHMIVNHYKFKRKPIIYKTGSMIKTNQKELGKSLRLIYDYTNSRYRYWYLLDYFDFDEIKQKYIKKTIKIPLSYNQDYHIDLNKYKDSLGRKRFGKDKSKKIYVKTMKGEEFENLLNVEHTISLSKRTNRLNITLTYKTQPIKQKPKKNILGIDIGGNIRNSLVLSSERFISFKHLNKIIKKVESVDKINPESSKEKINKGNLLAKILRENEYHINKEISRFLDYCEDNKIYDLSFEELSQWNVQWRRDKSTNQKYNRLFRLIRSSGLVELFRKQARNRGIRVHTVPSYYTSQLCSCGHISRDNRKSQSKFICVKCGHNDQADFNAAKNIKMYLERFSNDFLVLNSFQEYEPKRFISKEFVKNHITSQMVVN